MREILFRGKPTERFEDFLILRKEHAKKGFVTGSLVLAAENSAYICVGGFCSSRSIINNGVTTMVEVIPETAGQFINTFDKNGTKVFEGDILEHDLWGGFSERIWIHFDGTSFVYSRFRSKPERNCPIDDNDQGIIISDWEVIGNIYDNPELLEE